jgi:hypothetical protein
MGWLRQRQANIERARQETLMSRPRIFIHASLILFLTLLILSSLNAISAANQSQPERRYPTGSWGLGVVVPEGSGFVDGGRVSWANATAVSITVTLPNISLTDYPVYAVESVMAADGSIMQVAAGIYRNSTRWLGYGWYIKNVLAYPQDYLWVLNASKPDVASGASVSLSISRIQDRWQYGFEDLTSRESTAGDFPSSVPPVLRVGDQEVFALESYSASNGVFAQMGNLTLDAISINGRQIATGWYEYGAWQNRRVPLFVVGGLGPPPYISLQPSKDSTWVWSYAAWSGNQEVPPPSTSLLTVLVAVPLVVAVSGIVWITRRRIS